MDKNTLNAIEALVKLLPCNIYWIDLDNIYLGCNAFHATCFGLNTPKEIVGKRNYELPYFKQYPHLAELYDKNNHEAISSKKVITLEEPFILPDGTVATYLSYRVPLKQNKLVTGVLGLSLNISELKANEKQLLSEKQQIEVTLDQIIKYLPGHVYWKDKQGIYLGCNDTQAKSLGFNSRLEVIGKTDYEISRTREIADEIRKVDLDVINNNELLTVEEEVINDGKRAIVLSQKAPLKNNEGHTIGILGISLDITELKKAYQAKSNFLKIMSHDISQPVSNISGLLDIIINEFNAQGDKNLIKKHLATAKQEVDKIIPKINDITDYISFNPRAVTSNKSVGNIVDLIDRIVKTHNKQRTTHATVKIRIEPANVPSHCILDMENIYKVLTIIIHNAIKYTEKGHIHIKIDELNEFNKNYLVILVEDTGKGIFPEQLKAITDGSVMNDELQALKPFRKFSVKLPYAQLIVKHILNGELAITSEVDHGTTVMLKLPYEVAGDSAEDHLHHEEALPFAASHILLVEDNDVTRHLQEILLGQYHYQVDTAATGKEALEKAKAKTYDFIFLDINLPDIDGIQTFNKLKATCNKETPTIALTTNFAADDLNYFAEQGLLTTIQKPLTPEKLKAFFISYKKSIESE